MITLVEFLRARLYEDAERAQSCAGPHWCGCAHVDFVMTARDCDCGYPARALREIEAKRRIIDEHGPHEHYPSECRTCGCPDSCGCAGGVDFPCDTLRLLAAVYADHPDCRKEWRL